MRMDTPRDPGSTVGTGPLAGLLDRGEPLLALAPMQDVTDLPFWRLLSQYGGPDVYWTEYFRVHSTSTLERPILECLHKNPTGRPAIAQLIGNDIPSLVRAARELQHHPVAAIDLNLGCPAPVVYRKCAGGGLLREPKRIDAILAALRDAIQKPGIAFTVKTRIGFDTPAVFEELLEIFARNRPDLVTVHGRTVSEMYRTEVHYDFIGKAARSLRMPVLANGNVHSAVRAADVLEWTGARGLMIGRGCVRNPWIFDQIRDHLSGRPIRYPRGREVLQYVEALYEATTPAESRERLQVEKMKKYMNFVGAGIPPFGAASTGPGGFLYQIRRAETRGEFFRVCADFLAHDEPMTLIPPPDAPRVVQAAA
jgi:tRNA-dihydrouridine synthase